MKETFPIISATTGPLWFFGIFAAFMLGMTLLMGWLCMSSRTVKFEVSKAGLEITGGMYGRLIPLASLDLDAARRMDLSQDREHQPTLRTNGAGLPGYLAGWFRLRNGEKALLFVTDRRSVFYAPTREGYSVLLSVADVEGLKAALEGAGAG